ncbi:MAG: hypothetical protein ABI867_23060 [Kofleriaceae bacterium]
MTKSAANWLLVLGSMATLLGLWVLRFAYQTVRTKEALIAYGLLAVGLGFIAIGITKYKRTRVGLAIFVGGGALVAPWWPIALANRDAMMDGFAKTASLSAVAEAACTGGGDASPAAALATTGPRPILQVITSETGKVEHVGPWEDLAAPQTPGELQLVVCRTRHRTYDHGCTYTTKTKTTITISVYRLAETLEVREARTSSVLATQRFEGDKPSSQCDGAITTTSETRSRDAVGMSPNLAEQTAFVNRFVDPK